MSDTKDAPALETPEEVAERCYDDGDFDNMIAAIHEDRRAIAAWCEQKAQEAQREAQRLAVAGCDSNAADHAAQASAYRAVAETLRGAP